MIVETYVTSLECQQCGKRGRKGVELANDKGHKIALCEPCLAHHLHILKRIQKRITTVDEVL